MIYDRAYAPFGEPYAETATTNRNFTGQTEDTTPGLYDFLFRQQSQSQGRWLVPDPAGLAAVDITNPQTWNRYAYVGNNPLRYIDNMGLELEETCIGGYSQCEGGGSGGYGGGTSYYVDGASVSGSLAYSLLHTGAAAVCRGNDCSGQWIVDPVGGHILWLVNSSTTFNGSDSNGVFQFSHSGTWVDLGPEWLWNLSSTTGFPRDPDFISANVTVAIPNPYTATVVGWSGSLARDRYGNWYWSVLGLSVGKSLYGASVSVTPGWLNQLTTPSSTQLEQFLTTSGGNFGVGYWGGGGISYTPGSGTATVLGFYTPQIGLSYNYSFKLKW